MNKQFGNKPFGNRQFPVGNPLANVLVVIVGALVVGVSIVLGVVAFITLGALVLVLAAVIGIRVWWLGRKMRKQFAAGTNDSGQKSANVEIIEGEFRVVSPRKGRDSDSET
ncbi:MAG: hypothetical protein GXP15_01855 [Gammaproteobacteria bacterium]|nr:hypothetical protein [Gammaproteobacteria bacterium]